jgi:hypothetical protein
MKRTLAAATLALVGLASMYAFLPSPDAGTSPAWSAAEDAGVRAAVLDYVEGIYDVQPERIERSVHPELRKVGYVRQGDSWMSTPMTYDQLHTLAGRWNADGHLSADAPKEIQVLDVLDQTASAKLVADWGVDYFHLARIDGRWMIMNVIWQTPPAH